MARGIIAYQAQWLRHRRTVVDNTPASIRLQVLRTLQGLTVIVLYLLLNRHARPPQMPRLMV